MTGSQQKSSRYRNLLSKIVLIIIVQCRSYLSYQKQWKNLCTAQLSPFLESNEVFSQNRFGFCNRRSTELARTLFFDGIRSKVDKDHLVTALFLDFSKAFDTISHSKIIDKLPAYGIKGVESQWIRLPVQ